MARLQTEGVPETVYCQKASEFSSVHLSHLSFLKCRPTIKWMQLLLVLVLSRKLTLTIRSPAETRPTQDGWFGTILEIFTMEKWGWGPKTQRHKLEMDFMSYFFFLILQIFFAIMTMGEPQVAEQRENLPFYQDWHKKRQTFPLKFSFRLQVSCRLRYNTITFLAFAFGAARLSFN